MIISESTSVYLELDNIKPKIYLLIAMRFIAINNYQ